MKSFRRPLGFALICLGFFTASGCVSTDEFAKWADGVEPLKKTALQEVTSPTLGKTQHQAFKAYFSSLAVMAYSLQDDLAKAKDFESSFTAADAKSLCAKTLISRAQWTEFDQACSRNGFFLCADEVRAYPEIIASLRSRLHGEALSKFDGEPLCKSAL
jgi:hypothetical protein